MTTRAADSGSINEIEALRILLQAQFKTLEVRIDATDQAASVFSDNLNRVPTILDRETARLQALFTEKIDGCRSISDERLKGIQIQLKDRDLAVSAALTAQERTASAQDLSNAKAIEKSEEATSEAIKGLTTRFDDLKERVDSAEGKNAGASARLSMLVTVAALGIAAVTFASGFVRAPAPALPAVPPGYILVPAQPTQPTR